MHHAAEAKKAADLYRKSRTPARAAAAWHLALREARKQVADALRKSKMLAQVEDALEESGSYMIVFRALMAPPMSQDQFRILCPSWPKSSEKSGRGMPKAAATEVAKTFRRWRHKQLTSWMDKRIQPSQRHLRLVLTTVAPLIASQTVGTAWRKQLSREQESALIALLNARGWKRVQSKLIDTRASLKPMQYAYKTRFATSGARPQEVDVACGLKGTFVLALECKVTNDETNSVKRVNDVLKKAHAWKAHWGSFVETAALLQGVIAPKDVQRLIDEGVHVFWSHDLKSFEEWISKRV